MNTRRPFRFLSPFLTVSLLSGLSVLFAHAANAADRGLDRPHPTRLLAKMRGGTFSSQASATALAAAGVRVTHAFGLVPGLVVLDAAAPAVSAAPVRGAAANPRNRHARIQALMATGLFEYVEPDFPRFPCAVPNDEAFADGRHWNFLNTGQPGTVEGAPGVAGMDIDVVPAWDITTGSRDVIVAVIDTGVRYTHQDLATQMWRNPGEIAANGLDDDDDGYVDDVFGISTVDESGDPGDRVGHGTLVAGIIGAAANDGHPAVGVCWQVSLMAIRFLPSAQEEPAFNYVSAHLRALDYAVAHGARVVNASFGGSAYSQAEHDAIAAAGAQGLLYVSSAGNGYPGRDADLFPSFPAAYPLDNVVSVTGFRRDGEKDWWCNFGGGTVHLGAPTLEVFSTSHAADDAYGFLGGTSAAAPHVAGVAALLLAREPTLTSLQLRDRLLGSATPLDSLREKTVTGGRLDAHAALTTTADGTLDLLVFPGSGGTVFAGRSAIVEVRVTDVATVAAATVTGSSDGLPPLAFADDGVAPDRLAGDGTYAATFLVPPEAQSVAIAVEAAASGFTPVTKAVTYAVRQPPPNDAFADRVDLGPTEYTFAQTVNNVGATAEAGEPVPAADEGATGGRSVWWSWTAPRSARAVVTVWDGGSGDFDAVLGIYTGNTLATLAEIASNDDAGPRLGLPAVSEVVFDAVEGTTYAIAVAGYTTGDTGEGELDVLLRPVNDDFADRTVLAGTSVAAPARLSGATSEQEQPQFRGNDVWWTWTAPADGLVTIRPGESLVNGTVYLRVAGEAGRFVGDNLRGFDLSESGRVSFLAREGETFDILADSFDMLGDPLHGPATFTLHIDLSLPAVVVPPAVVAGDLLTLSTDLRGLEGATCRWYRDGVEIAGVTGPTLILPGVQRFHAGSYSVAVSWNGMEVVSAPAEISVETPPRSDARVTNLSTRAWCRTGDEAIIPGFVIAGGDARRLLMRAVGPELVPFGVGNALPNPEMILKRRESAGFVDFAENDDWGDNANWQQIRDTAESVHAFPLLDGSRSAALLMDLPPGTYTIVASDAAGLAGVGLVELYDIDSGAGAAGARLVNLSNRGYVGTGNELMIPGFVVSEPGPKTFLMRAIGPTLIEHGVSGVLADPQLHVYRRDSTGAEQLILANDNWGENGDAAEIAAAAAQVYAFPLPAGSADAAFVVTLAPGTYTLHASGVGRTTGIGLVELYAMP